MSGRRKKRQALAYRDVELNIMPFIDVFSMLNTFLLFSAVFLSVGIIEVQIPFLSNAPQDDKSKPTRDLKVSVDVSKEKIVLDASYTAPPENKDQTTFPNNAEGHKQLHAKLVSLRQTSPDTDKATFFSEDDVNWENLTLVLDAVMLRGPTDPVFPPSKDEKDPRRAEANAKLFVYPKIVFGSVILR